MKTVLVVVALLATVCFSLVAARSDLKQRVGMLNHAEVATRDAVDDTFDTCVSNAVALNDQSLVNFAPHALSDEEQDQMWGSIESRGGARMSTAWKKRLQKEYCYSVCYLKNLKTDLTGNVLATYDPTTYKSEGIKALTNIFKLKVGTTTAQLYKAYDWSHNEITTAISDKNLKNAFLFLTTEAHDTARDATLANTIRMTIQIKFGDDAATRATNLWGVLEALVTATKPSWLKVDTPRLVREDSIILSFKAVGADKKKEIVKAVCDVLNGGTVKPKLSFALPPYQHKKECPLLSVADYFYGNSFGTVLCNRKIDLGTSFATTWAAQKHPTTDAWDFLDPTDITSQERF